MSWPRNSLVMVRYDRSSCAEAIKYATDTTLVHEDEITVQELIQLLAERVVRWMKPLYGRNHGNSLNPG